jgi:2'-5' RNA ligase
MERLCKACDKCPPFYLRLEQFGTFGGSHRGVLWVYPESSTTSMTMTDDSSGSEIVSSGIATATAAARTEPLMELQRLLQEQFPDCNDQSKAGGENVYRPHMTLSHFVNLQAAKTAQEQVESWWPSSNSNNSNATIDPTMSTPTTPTETTREGVTFWVPEIYLLYRDGPNGQFYRVADLGLGVGDAAGNTKQQRTTIHDPPIPFVHMPVEEPAWVRQERLAMQDRRRKNQRGGGRGGGRGRSRSGGGHDQTRSRSQRVPDAPEVIAAKRAARAAKRLATEAAAALDVPEEE